MLSSKWLSLPCLLQLRILHCSQGAPGATELEQFLLDCLTVYVAWAGSCDIGRLTYVPLPAAGVELLQPSTAFAGVLLALLLGNSARVALLSSANAPRRELALQAQITQAAARRGAQVASVLGAVVVLMYRRLSGHLLLQSHHVNMHATSVIP